METIKSILDTLKEAVETSQTNSPVWWLDNAMKLAVLRQDLQEEMVKAEIAYRNEVVQLTNMDVPTNKAENDIKGRALREGEKMTAYQFYNYLRTRDSVVQEIIRISKKRATFEYEI